MPITTNGDAHSAGEVHPVVAQGKVDVNSHEKGRGAHDDGQKSRALKKIAHGDVMMFQR